jgi:ferric-dicitrate binding protein FerR (iron transport regulator)
MSDENRSAEREEAIGKLIAKAGPGPTASPEARQRIYSAVRARWEAEIARPRDARNAGADRSGRRYSRRFFSPRTIGMAAAVSAIAVALAWLVNLETDVPAGTQLAQYTVVEGRTEVRRDAAPPERPMAAAATGTILVGDTVVTGVDGRIELRRPDGLLLRMNVSTEIRFEQPDEIDLVAGTIYIDSGAGVRKEALAVNTPLGAVEHVGTQYEVRFAESALRIRVREGEITWSGATETVGSAGEQIVIDAAGTAVRSAIAPNDPAWDWAVSLATLPVADEYRVSETFIWIARELGLRLDATPVMRQRIANLRPIVGLEGLTPAEALEALAAVEPTAGLEVEISGDRLVVSD